MDSDIAKTAHDLRADIDAISRIEIIPKILDIVCRTTKMGFSAVSRITEDRWIACSVLDSIDYGIKPGDELKLENTICQEIRHNRQTVVISHVAQDPMWRQHRVPNIYGFQSYISAPIILADDSFFGTLCAVDPHPAEIDTKEITGSIELFAELIARHLDTGKKLAGAEDALRKERAIAEMREHFVAVLGHDLRNPAATVVTLADVLLEMSLGDKAAGLITHMKNAASRALALIDGLMEFSRIRLGGGLPLTRSSTEPLEPLLRSVVAEYKASHPESHPEAMFRIARPVNCDRHRIAQLLSNLLSNAINHGDPDQPVRVQAVVADDQFELFVANAGKPIPPAELERIFQPFHRSTLGRHGSGLGLGLYIAHEIADAHGGTLTAESTERETRFTFRMPV